MAPKTFTYKWYDNEHTWHETSLPEDGYAIGRVGALFKVYDRATTKLVGLHEHMHEAEAQVVELNGEPDLRWFAQYPTCGSPVNVLSTLHEMPYLIQVLLLKSGDGFPATDEGIHDALTASGVLPLLQTTSAEVVVEVKKIIEQHKEPVNSVVFIIRHKGRSYTSYPCVPPTKTYVVSQKFGGQARWL